MTHPALHSFDTTSFILAEASAALAWKQYGKGLNCLPSIPTIMELWSADKSPSQDLYCRLLYLRLQSLMRALIDMEQYCNAAVDLPTKQPSAIKTWDLLFVDAIDVMGGWAEAIEAQKDSQYQAGRKKGVEFWIGNNEDEIAKAEYLVRLNAIKKSQAIPAWEPPRRRCQWYICEDFTSWAGL